MIKGGFTVFVVYFIHLPVASVYECEIVVFYDRGAEIFSVLPEVTALFLHRAVWFITSVGFGIVFTVPFIVIVLGDFIRDCC